MSNSEDPFAPQADADIDLDLGQGYDIGRKRRATLEPHKEFIEDANRNLRPKESYAQRQHTTRRHYWTLTRIPVLLILGWFTLSHLALDSSWIFIDGVNLLFHEAGHPLFKWGGDTLYFLGGSLNQLLWPAALAGYFALKRRERFAATACAWWFGENLLNVSRYMHDAPVEELPLVGGNTHDWNHLFGKWDMIRQARDVADVVRVLGALIMLGTMAYLLWMTLKPTERELAEGFRA